MQKEVKAKAFGDDIRRKTQTIPFVRSNPKKLDTLGQMLKFFCKRNQKTCQDPLAGL